jgi:sugar lactone lactonase YvrE
MSRTHTNLSRASALASIAFCLWPLWPRHVVPHATTKVSLVVETIAPDSLLHGPDGATLDSLGNLYIANYDGGKGSTVVRITPAGKASVFASGFRAPDGLVFDARGSLYVSNFASGTIERIGPDGARSVFATGLDHPSSLAFDRAGNLYVSNFGNFDGRTVTRITPSGVASTFASGFAAPLGLTFGSDGTLFVSNFASGVVHRVSREGAVSVLATLTNAPRAMLQYLAFADANTLIVPSYGYHRIYRIAADGAVGVFAGNGAVGGRDGAADSASFDGPNSIVRASSDEWYVTEYNANRLRRIRLGPH